MKSINVDLAYLDHPKTRKLVRRLGEGAEVLPLRLWLHTGSHHEETGVLAGYRAEEIESVIGWRGEPGEAVEALFALGFLDRAGKSYAVHNWCEHQGPLAPAKKLVAKAKKAR